jgi:hypothetical protein
MQPRIEIRKVVAERVSRDGNTISQFCECVTEDDITNFIQNREKTIQNVPPEGEYMRDYNYMGQGDPIQNDSCRGVPVLEPHMNRQDGESNTTFCNVDGDQVPVLEPPHYDIGRKIKTREQPKTVTNDSEDADVPVLEPPTNDVPRNER